MAKKEKSKPTKKRVLLYYLILAACILVIAAVTIAVVFSVNGNNLPLDSTGDQQQGGGSDDNNGGNNGGDDDGNGGVEDTSSAYEFIVPIKHVDLAKAHVFDYNKTMDWYCLHEGMDFKAPVGTEVLAAIDGKVIAISYKATDLLYGDSVTIEHANGVTTVYKFIDLADNISVGTRVNRGDVIGTVASANGVENADGDHLHFEVFKNDESVDPDIYLNILSK